MNGSANYTNRMPLAAFPLGGLGTGSVTLHASGALTEFEIFNRPAKGNKLPYSFFAIHTAWSDCTDARVLEAKRMPDFDRARGYHPQQVMGLPRFAASRMETAFPFARIDFEEESLPVSVSLEAFVPFIPLNEDDSGIPAAVFRYRVKNTGGVKAKVLIAASMPNIYGFRGFDCFDNYRPFEGRENKEIREAGISGVFMTGSGLAEDALTFGNSAILVPDESALVKPYWHRSRWYDSVADFWNCFSAGHLEHVGMEGVQRSAIGPLGYPVGSAGLEKTINPGVEEDFLFILSWYVPNRFRGWFQDDNPGQTMKNHYATRFASALDAGQYLLHNLPRLEAQSRLFADALQGSTLPRPVISAVADNLTVLTSNTCFRDATGTFLAWEGCHEQEGSCHGTCTHVWNYAQSAAWLFPAMERSARLNEFLYEVEPNGKMNFRAMKRFGLPAFNMHAAADGQLGTIVRAWREYLLSGDKEFLAAIYPRILRCLAYCEKTWDADGDGLLEGLQHNTYDIEFCGVNPLSGVFYLAALRAVERLAEAMDDPVSAKRAAEKYAASRAALDKACFNGAYYEQVIEDKDSPPYQFGKGCLSDQLLGQAMASLYGLGELLPKTHIKSAIKAVYDNNFLDGDHRGSCMQRLYIADDEKGLVLCSWPKGGKPRFPFVYSDEVWTGIEYQVAALLIQQGFVEEGLNIVSAVRKRYDGIRRNPFSEMECGYHYARSLAGYGVMVAFCGLQLTPEGDISFDPVINESDFHCFYCDGRHFGILHQTISKNGRKEKFVEILL
ncbi:MAG: hypothetical protein JW811_05275 [Clostridiales bacterium]|nr:hypothetical protein [Clostridiales bacterium]